jgi:protein-tyrosine kinase
MEPIRKAIERLKSKRSVEFDLTQYRRPDARKAVPVVGRAARDFPENEIALNPRHLEAHRIVAHDTADPRSMPFDMLRTQVLQATDRKKWQIIGVTSPTPGCGKTFTAVNLALSIARQPERSALLADMDLMRPSLARCLGLKSRSGLINVLEEQIALDDAIEQVSVGNCRCAVLQTGHAVSDSAGWMASRAMTDLFDEFRRNHRSRLVLLDLPPILSTDDVITILPQIDCVLLVVAAGITTPAQIEDCGRHLQSADIVRVVLNKAPESSMTYHSGGY